MSSGVKTNDLQCQFYICYNKSRNVLYTEAYTNPLASKHFAYRWITTRDNAYIDPSENWFLASLDERKGLVAPSYDFIFESPQWWPNLLASQQNCKPTKLNKRNNYLLIIIVSIIITTVILIIIIFFLLLNVFGNVYCRRQNIVYFYNDGKS